MKHLCRAVAAAAALVAAEAGMANAHILGAGGAGFPEGFLHPTGGADHLLAVVAVGLWAAQLGGRMLWGLPLTFVLTMGIGGAVGMSGAPLPRVEGGILASVLVLGAAVALARRWPAAICMALVGSFAIFHGYAHGAEMPLAVSPLAYGLGFVLGTFALHAMGVGAGVLLARAGDRPGRLVRLGGGAIVAGGVAIWLGL